MLTRIAFRINSALERYFPEQRLFLKSDHGTHFIRLRPLTQTFVVTVGALGLAWTIVATALIMMQTIGAGSAREQSQRQSQMFEQRLALLSSDRDLRAQEAVQAQERFNFALDQVSAMQEMLLASEDRRRELETGIDVVQNTLRSVIRERDEARAEIERLGLVMSEQGSGGATEMGRIRDTELTLGYLTSALGRTAEERDAKEAIAEATRAELIAAEQDRRTEKLRNDAIFAKLEEAVEVSIGPLDKMFRDAGLNPSDLIATVRRGYSGSGGPLSPISASTMGGALTPEEARANAILKAMEEMDLYRIAAFMAPFDSPIKAGGIRMTSGFGTRNDPFGAGRRRHEGQDYAGPYGTPILSTADGVVTFAGWQSGYGRLVKIQHAFGIETRYAHMSQIRVQVGQKVSRGDRIGDMGNSGRSTGTHLHYEVRIGGTAVNPMNFIRAARNVF
ncbi:DUF5930 domain-containing protein [Pseudogemmobacter sonorensis]|uniref:DUF5930 domain-containing protein n=1 Tax=Pseudogemmobacter sonorensis TaxID=2989681 RepID=UPI0036AED2E8